MKRIVLQIFFLIGFEQCIFANAEYNIGAYYFAGWWREPAPAHYLNLGLDWRPSWPERKPLLGWYDDRQWVIDKEILLASSHGIDFFMFDFFADRADGVEFSGARTNNNNGLKFFLTSRYKERMMFAILYENAARPITDLKQWEHYADLWVSYFLDPQYYRINGKPVFMVILGLGLRADFGSNADVILALDTLRQKAIDAGIPEILIGCGLASPPTLAQLALGQTLGYDFYSAYAFNYASLPDGANEFSVIVPLAVSEYNAFITSPLGFAPYNVVARDRRAIEKFNEPYFINRTPEIYNAELQLGKDFIDNNPQLLIDQTQKLILINAWNEIGAGGALNVPVEDGFAYLDQISAVFP